MSLIPTLVVSGTSRGGHSASMQRPNGIIVADVAAYGSEPAAASKALLFSATHVSNKAVFRDMVLRLFRTFLLLLKTCVMLCFRISFL